MKALLVTVLLFSNACFSQNTILWRITDTVNRKTSFVVGTYHHIGNSFVDSLPIIQHALLSSDLAIFESVDDEKVVSDIVNRRESQNQIKELLTEDDFAKLTEISKDWKIGINQLKPIEMLLTLRREFQISKCNSVKVTDTFDHFDNYLIYLARKNNRPLMGLETDSLQLNILEEISDSWDREAVRDEISYWISKLTVNEDKYEECQLAEQYMRFELDYEFTKDCDDDVLIRKRNQEWLTQLTMLISRKNCFIAVGLLHLNYTCGLLESFRKQGFVVSPVDMKGKMLSGDQRH